MSNKSSTSQNTSYDDEIDLFELAQELWREKLLVITVTLAVFLSALAYVISVPTVYTHTAETTLRQASLHHYGPLAAALRTEEKQGVQTATELIGANFLLIRKNLENTFLQDQFIQQILSDGSIRISVDVPIDARDRLARDRLALDTLTLSISSSTDQELKEYTKQYLDFISHHTAEEINEFLVGLGVDQEVSTDMLYSIDKPTSFKAVEAKPKKKLILAVGFVLGGMLGLFAALISSAIRKRQQQQTEN